MAGPSGLSTRRAGRSFCPRLWPSARPGAGRSGPLHCGPRSRSHGPGWRARSPSRRRRDQGWLLQRSSCGLPRSRAGPRRTGRQGRADAAVIAPRPSGPPRGGWSWYRHGMSVVRPLDADQGAWADASGSPSSSHILHTPSGQPHTVPAIRLAIRHSDASLVRPARTRSTRSSVRQACQWSGLSLHPLADQLLPCGAEQGSEVCQRHEVVACLHPVGPV